MKLLEHKNLLIERAPGHRVAAQVPFYEEPVLCALHNRSDDKEGEGTFVTESSEPVMLAVDWDPMDAWQRLVGKFDQNKEGHAALFSVYKGPKDFAQSVGDLEDATEVVVEMKGTTDAKQRKQKAEPAQAAA
jgi:hypothetical protein